MSNANDPKDTDSLSLKPSASTPGRDDRASDFSRVRSSVASTEAEAPKADFGNVRSSVASTEQAVGDRLHTVARGETLSHIAQAVYGRASQWRRIFDANRDQLDDPDRIHPGQVLKIPAADDGDA
jgi:nucleoid-associated protein YgaU